MVDSEEHGYAVILYYYPDQHDYTFGNICSEQLISWPDFAIILSNNCMFENVGGGQRRAWLRCYTLLLS